MAFGQTLKEAQKGNSTEGNTFNSPFLPTKSGKRVFRVLPIYDNEGNLIAPTETRWLEVWWEVNVETPFKKRRLMLNWLNPYENPIWEYIQATTEPKSKDRSAKMPKNKFALNVLDRTPVIVLENGDVVYADETNKWTISANNKFIPEVKADIKAAPLNQVRILEGSAGREGGKHLLQNLVTTSENIDHPSGDGRLAQLYEVDLRLSTTGRDLDDTSRGFFITSNFKPLTKKELALPRYDLEAWTKPWPNDALQALLDGKNFDEVVEQHGIVLYPKLIQKEEDEDTPDFTNPATYTRRANVFDEDLPF
jgi:hypothetical protein